MRVSVHQSDSEPEGESQVRVIVERSILPGVHTQDPRSNKMHATTATLIFLFEREQTKQKTFGGEMSTCQKLQEQPNGQLDLANHL